MLTELDFAGFALGINTAGDIVGAHIDEAGNEHPFLLKNGSDTILDLDTVMDYVPPQNGDYWRAMSINDAGQIVVQGIEPNNVNGHVYVLTPR